MKGHLLDRRIFLAGVAILVAVLLFIRPSTLPVASAQDANANRNTNANKSTPKKTPAKKPVAKKPTAKKSPTANSNTSNAANAAADERTYWESIRNSTDPADFRAYLKEYPNGKYVTLATNRLNSLDAAARQAAANNSKPTTTSSPPANTTSAGKQVRNSKGIEMVWIPPGSFDMGSNNGSSNEKPVHRVTISQGFFMGKYEVTQAQWQSVMGSNPSNFKGDNLPVQTVSWDDAITFIARLNAQNDGYSYWLPTEAEWEYACRAGTTGDYADDLDAMGWYDKNSGSKTHAVGSKLPNSFGLFDMLGNVWEWCQDWYHDSYNGAPTDGSAWLSGGGQTYRVLRGGSWYDGAAFLGSAGRGLLTPDDRRRYSGFRLVAVVRTQ